MCGRKPGWLVGIFGLLMFSCHPDRTYESVMQITGKDTVEVDDKGNATIVAFEMEWDPCPGDQIQVIRGGADFAKCTANYKEGDYVHVIVKQWWDSRGFYDWDIESMGGCTRPILPEVEGSFNRSQECHEVQEFGRPRGFDCDRKPRARLLTVCPWTARD